MRQPVVRFGPYTLVPAERRLLRDGDEVALGPRAFDVLCVLSQRAGEVVTKEELLDGAWPGLVVEEANLHVQVSHLRKALGTQAIANLPGRGYRLALPVRRLPDTARESRRLSIIVLPFVEPGAPADQSYFADAITDDITMQLCRIKGSFVIATPTAMAFKSESFDLQATARELGVRYVLQGRIERDGDRLELTARLSDAGTHEVIWSDAFAVAATHVRALRREVVARLAVALDLELIHAEAERSRAPGTPNPQAIDLLMQARDPRWRNWNLRDWNQPLALVERALRIDPDDSEALIESARLRVLNTIFLPVPDIEAQLAIADGQLKRALAAEPTNAIGQYALSLLRRQQYRVDEAVQAADRALELNPNLVVALSARGELFVWQGLPERSIEPVERAMQLSPRDPTHQLNLVRLGRSHLMLGNVQTALPTLRQAYGMRGHVGPAFFLAIALITSGDAEEGCAIYREWQERIIDALAWWRGSPNPVYQRLWRERFAAPLVRAGAQPDISVFDAWLDRQRRCGI